MTPATTLKALWHSVPGQTQTFDAAAIASLPPVAQRYLVHAIAPNTPLATAVRLRIHGQIKLKAWSPFRAEQVIYPQRGMIW